MSLRRWGRGILLTGALLLALVAPVWAQYSGTVTFPLGVDAIASSSGTTVNLLVIATGSTVETAAIGIGAPTIGIAAATATSGQPVFVVTGGVYTCVADNVVGNGELLTPGSTTAGRCRGTGTTDLSTIPNTTRVIGLSRSGGNPGSVVEVQLFGTGEYGPAVAESALTLTDITTNNASTTKHGFVPKLSNVAGEYFNGVGGYTVPAGPTTVRLASDVSTSVSATYADVTGLTFTPAANKDYLVEFFLIFEGDTATVGSDYSVNGPSGGQTSCRLATQQTGGAENLGFIIAYDTNNGKGISVLTGQLMQAQMVCLFRNGANATAFTLRQRLETGSAAVNTTKAGSTLRYTLLN